MANRHTVIHGTLEDLKDFLIRDGWTLEEPVGIDEVLRAKKPNKKYPLIIWDRMYGGAYSIDERDWGVYAAWRKDRVARGLHPKWPSQEEKERYEHGR